MEKEVEKPAPVDAAALAVAAHDVRQIVRWIPDRAIWAPGRPIWGLALVSGSDRAILSIDGCLAIALTIWPGHYIKGGYYPLDSIARILANSMGIKQLDGATLFSCHLPQSTSGSCCVIVTQKELPWLTPDLALMPLRDLPAFTVPEDPSVLVHHPTVHPLVSLVGLREPSRTAVEFYVGLGEPVDARLLPDKWRAEQLLNFWRLQARCERERLRFVEYAIPAWLEDDRERMRLVRAWMQSWRGPDDPGEQREEDVSVVSEHRQPTVGPVAPVAPVAQAPPKTPFLGKGIPWKPTIS
jgi:hypothetical protein